MRNNYVFVIDCDEVIRPLIRNMIDVYNNAFGTSLSYEDIEDFDVDVSFPLVSPNAADWFFNMHRDEVYTMRPPIEGAVESIAKLRQYGKVVIATYQKSIENKLLTLNWFDKYGVTYDDIFFGADKKLINCDYFIDDNPVYFAGSIGKHGILIDASHNRDVDLHELKKQSRCNRVSRYNSLKDFTDTFIFYHQF